ncbi:MAG: hypothetical protein M1586_01020 [Patescibacteria group bacterium]|nr:hypothetical protein [Patescibacteria group bacterium]MCL5261868.1 hypothetical protein [Patescibacteria group bacterium]
MFLYYQKIALTAIEIVPRRAAAILMRKKTIRSLEIKSLCGEIVSGQQK